uniref:Uncharacterized protein n=1 Tax=Arion vulgaris TaxID=1028688 RepID=A0A0B7B2B1_9EUPU
MLADGECTQDINARIIKVKLRGESLWLSDYAFALRSGHEFESRQHHSVHE